MSNKTEILSFIEWFDENESKVLEVIGDRHRLLFMTKNMRGALQEQISEIVYQLSINKKKSVLAIPMDKRSDGENRMLELLKKGMKLE